jgi:hypothetical protein
MATKLGVYNDALELIGERSLSSVSENREPRRVLDGRYDSALNYCLEAGYWNFAMRSVEFTADTVVEPPFGFTYAFEKPSDWIRTAALSDSETFMTPLRHYVDEGDYWFADITPIYVRYVSNGATYGLDLTRWPETFTRYVVAHLAAEICERLTQNSSKLEELRRLEKRRLADAKAKDAINDPVGRVPTGSWVLSRGAFRRHDRA